FSIAYGNLPYASETLAAFGYGIVQNVSIITFLHSIHFIFFLITLYHLTNKFFDLSLGRYLIFVVLLLSTHFVNVLLSTSYVDVLVAAYQMISILILLISNKVGKNKYLLYSIYFVTFSLILKYPALYFLPVYLLVFIHFLIKRK